MEEIRVINHAGSELSQAMIGGEVSIPVGKPEMKSVLMVTARAETGLAELLEGKALADGTVTLTVCYICEEGQIHAFESVSSFKHNVQMERAHVGMRGTAQAWVCKVDYTMIDARRLNISAAVDVLISMEEETDIQAVTSDGLSSDIVAQTKEIMATKNVAISTTAAQIEGEVMLTGEPIDRILFCEGRAVVKDCFCENGTVGLQGVVKLALIYATGDETTPVAQAFTSFPFEEMVTVPAVHENCRARARVRVKDVYPEVDDTGLHVSVQAVCSMEVALEEPVSISAVSDAYSLSGDLRLETADIRIRRRVASADGSTAVREKAYATKAQKVLAAWATPSAARALDEDGSTVIEGMLSCNVIYLDAESQVTSFVQEVPVRIVEEMPQLAGVQDMEAMLAVEQVQAIPTGDEFDIRVLLEWNVDGYTIAQEQIVQAMAVEESEQIARKGIVIYFAASDETLWTVAKRYKTSLDEIYRYNPGVAETLNDGDRLVLVCR